MQGISNMGTKFRLQVGKIPAGVVVGHSANVLEIIDDEIKFIHSSVQSGVIISSTKEPYYAKRFIQINRVINQ
jgi:hypothetical protein